MEGTENVLIQTLEKLKKCSTKGEAEDLSRDVGWGKQAMEEYDPSKVRRLKKSLKTLTQEVKDLIQQGNFAEGIMLDVYEKGNVLPVANLAGEATAKRMMKEIWDSLMNKDVTKIGVCGMGGIGKTTVLKHVHNYLLDEGDDTFDRVIWVTVSKAFDVLTLQNNIASNLDLDLSRFKDATNRASKIHAALKLVGRYVLVLDDLWEGFSLEDVGIPNPSSENGCKLILTTRLLDVCHYMGCKLIHMVLLENDEACNLFFDHVGPEVLCVEKLKPFMEEVIKECACLPLAIVTVARSMRCEIEESEWRIALRQMKAYSREPDDKGAKVIEQLKFSYDRLRHSRLQDCLRNCALYPEDEEISIEGLISRLVDEGIIGHMQPIQEQLDEGSVLLNALAKTCLLERGTTNYGLEYVKMHDLVRDMTLSLSPLFMVQTRCCSTIFPEKEKWTEDLAKVSFMRNRVSEIPSNLSPKCPNITTLLLCDTGLESIPDSFFLNLPGLKVLDLSSTDIEILPDSISNLQSLIALLLEDCYRLWKVPSLAKLENLKKLNLSGTSLREIPEGLKNLSNLRYLDLRFGRRKAFPPGLLPKFQCLESLFIDQIVNAKDLMTLEKLRIFEGHLGDINDLSIFSQQMDSHGRFTNYNIKVGEHIQSRKPSQKDHFAGDYKRLLYIANININMSRDIKDSCVVLKDLQLLSIENCGDAASLCDVMSFDMTTRFELCSISKCKGMTHLFTASSSLAFQSLSILRVMRMENFRDLIKRESASLSPLPPFTFSHLKEFILDRCPKIEKLFSVEILCNFLNLESLTINYCEKLTEIATNSSNVDAKDVVEEENMDTFTFTLPKLRKFHLSYLPELKSICPRYGVLVLESLEKMTLVKCPKLERIPFPLDSHGLTSLPPSVTFICMRRKVWDSQQWNHHTKRGKLSYSRDEEEVTYKFDDNRLARLLIQQPFSTICSL